jgi:hypothetical protein
MTSSTRLWRSREHQWAARSAAVPPAGPQVVGQAVEMFAHMPEVLNQEGSRQALGGHAPKGWGRRPAMKAMAWADRAPHAVAQSGHGRAELFHRFGRSGVARLQDERPARLVCPAGKRPRRRPERNGFAYGPSSSTVSAVAESALKPPSAGSESGAGENRLAPPTTGALQRSWRSSWSFNTRSPSSRTTRSTSAGLTSKSANRAKSLASLAKRRARPGPSDLFHEPPRHLGPRLQAQTPRPAAPLAGAWPGHSQTKTLEDNLSQQGSRPAPTPCPNRRKGLSLKGLADGAVAAAGGKSRFAPPQSLRLQKRLEFFHLSDQQALPNPLPLGIWQNAAHRLFDLLLERFRVRHLFHSLNLPAFAPPLPSPFLPPTESPSRTLGRRSLTALANAPTK